MKAPTTTVTSSPFLGDELELSEEDWAQMDALMTQATTKGSSRHRPPVSTKHQNDTVVRNTHNDETFSTKDWKAIQAIDESLARARGHAPSVLSEQEAQHQQPVDDETMDEFGDLPMIDFEAMDQQIAQRATTNTAAIPEQSLVVRNPVSPTFDPQTSFIAFTRYKVVGTQIDDNTYTKTRLSKGMEYSNAQGQCQAVNASRVLVRGAPRSDTRRMSRRTCFASRRMVSYSCEQGRCDSSLFLEWQV